MDNQQQDNQFYNKMTKTPVEKLIIKLAIPTILSMLITSFYNMIDTFFIGKINTSATGAVGIVFSFTAIIQAIGFFLDTVPVILFHESSVKTIMKLPNECQLPVF